LAEKKRLEEEELRAQELQKANDLTQQNLDIE
jgi:hypothetical protein